MSTELEEIDAEEADQDVGRLRYARNMLRLAVDNHSVTPHGHLAEEAAQWASVVLALREGDR